MASIDNVTDLTPRVQYTASAAQVAFDYPFPIFEDADLVVDVDGTTKTLTTDYTVSGEGDDTGGTVTFVVAMSGGEIVTIYRDIAVARSTDIQQNGPLSSTTWNDEIDKIMLILQQLEDRIGRCVRFPITGIVTNAQAEMAPISNFFGKFLRITSAGILEAAAVTDSVVTLSAEVIGALLYPETAAETTAGATIVAYRYPEGYVLRYTTNAVPGTTDITAGIQTAIDVMEAAGGGEVVLDKLMSISSELTIDNHGVVLVGVSGTRGTSTAAGSRLFYTGSGTALTVDGVNGGGIRGGLRLENTGTGTIGFNFVDSQNFYAENFHVREFSADNWLFGSTTAVSCIYNTFINCSGWTAGATANGIRMYEGSGKATNNNVWMNSNFGNNAVGIRQDDECHDNSFHICELGSCTKGAELRGRTHMVANVESCTTGIELVSGSAASIFGYLHFASNSTDVSNSGNLSIFAAMHGGDSGSPLAISPSNTGIGLRGATPPSAGGINFVINDGDPVLQRAGATHVVLEDSNYRVDVDIELNGDINHDGDEVGFYGATPVAQQTGVAVSAAGIHAALVNLGLITA